MSALDKVIKAAGSARKLSHALGVTSMSVSHWKNRDHGMVPPNYIFPIFKMTGVTPHELRPDLYPNPTDGLPSQEASAKQP
ncbi:helix-turn-helix domain-containing protein [Salmonella enterica]|nr:Rha family transcriptional regulator [Salmonella enterica]EDB7222720.1 helix-turn-helix domain-containing protein [Salmonella enterica]EDB7232044.1 helix-turn-helix domain-containing protein [Salmonella enterica subsp. enterica serovar 4,[5],12:i:-]